MCVGGGGGGCRVGKGGGCSTGRGGGGGGGGGVPCSSLVPTDGLLSWSEEFFFSFLHFVVDGPIDHWEARREGVRVYVVGL